MQMQSKEYNELIKQMKAKLDNAEVELILESGEKFKMEFQKGKLKDFNVNAWSKVGIAIISEGVQSYSSTEDLSASSIMKSFDRAYDSLEFLKKNSKASLQLRFYPQQSAIKAMPELYVEEDVSVEAKKQLAFQLEDLAFKQDSRVSAVVYSGFVESKYELRMLNSLGMDCGYQQRFYSAYVGPLLKENNFAKMDTASTHVRHFSDINVSELARLAVERASSHLGAHSLPSGHYPIIIDKEVTPLFLQMISQFFSAIEVEKKTSLFKDKINQKIASTMINIIDDPFDITGLQARPFDSEGMASQKHTLVENGILKKFLTNKEYAEKLNLEHTAHACRRASGATDIEPSNLYIQKGTTSLVELLGRYPKAIYINKFAGSFHGGYKESTGDFSLPCEGAFVENGKLGEPVDQFVVSGNILEFLNKIEDIGDTYGKLNSTQWGPDLLISSLSVAGK
jgi:PmbA protein